MEKIIALGVWALVIVVAMKDTTTSTFNIELILRQMKNEIEHLRNAVSELGKDK